MNNNHTKDKEQSYNAIKDTKLMQLLSKIIKNGKVEVGLNLSIGGTTGLALLISTLEKSIWAFLPWVNPIVIANPALFGSAIGIICITTIFTITRVIFLQKTIKDKIANYPPKDREEFARIIFGQTVYLISRLDSQEQYKYREYLLKRLNKMLSFDNEEANKILDNFFNKKIEELIVEIEKKPSKELDRDIVTFLIMKSVEELNEIKNDIIGTDKKTKIKVDKILKEIKQIYLKGIKIEDINLSSKTQGLKLLYVLKLLTDQSDMFEDASEIKRNYLYSLDIKDDSISKELCEKKRVKNYEIKLYLKMLTVPNENKDLILKEVEEELTNVANQYQINKESKKNNNKRYIAKTIDKLKKMIYTKRNT